MNLKSFTLSNITRQSRILLDRFRGLDFLTPIHSEDMGLDPKYVYNSSPSGDKYLMNVLGNLNISSQDSIIDIGCGKGSAMRSMLKFPFERIDGIELSEYIATIAIRNFRKLNTLRSNVFVCDAALFKNYDAYNIVYLYNPFPSSVMSSVVDALIQSIYRSERELVIIYNGGNCHDMIISQGIFVKIGTYPNKWGDGITIYSNRGGANSRLSDSKGMQRLQEKDI